MRNKENAEKYIQTRIKDSKIGKILKPNPESFASGRAAMSPRVKRDKALSR